MMNDKVIELKRRDKTVLSRKCSICGKSYEYVLSLGCERYSTTTALCDECFEDLEMEVIQIRRLKMMIEGIVNMSSSFYPAPLTEEMVKKLSQEEIEELHKRLSKKVIEEFNK